MLGCSGAAPPLDAASPRDGTVSDSTISSDAPGDAPIAAPDSAAVDGSSPSCGGACDPRALTSSCSSDTLCRFVSGIPTCVVRASPDGGQGTDGAACAYDADCGAGLACFGAAGLGTCGRPCCGTRMDCTADERCRGDGALVDGTTTSWGRCLPPVSCDLAHPEHACATREGCYIVDGSGNTECLTAGSVPAGGTCSGASDCLPGHVCTGLASRTCVAICFLSSVAPHQGCADLEHCQAQAYSPAGTGICTAT